MSGAPVPDSPALVVQTSYLGDVILTTPLLTELSRTRPVDALVTRAGAAVLENHPAVRETIVYDKRGNDRGLRGFASLRARVRGAGYGAAYHAQGSLRSAALTATAGVPVRIGFSTSSGRLLYSHRVRYRPDHHHALRLWSLAGANAGAEVPPPRVYPGEAERRAVDELLGGVEPGAAVVALAPGSAWGTKRWPYYPALGAMLSVTFRIAVVGGAEDRPSAAEISDAIRVVGGSEPIDCTGRLSLLGSAELIRRCAVLVTNDSAPQHLASAVSTPTISVFGPTVPAFGFGPLAPHSVALGHETLPCRPCHRHGPPSCPLAHWRCMREIAAKQVAAQVRLVVDSTSIRA